MNTRTVEYMGAVKEVWVREDNPSNRKYYEAESDFWKILSKILGGRELKDIDLAIGILEENTERLENARSGMTAGEAELADFYMKRIEILRSFFKFARLVLTTILEEAENIDLGEVKRVDIE